MSKAVGQEKRIFILSFLEPWSMGTGQGAPSLYETLAGYARDGWIVDYVTFEKRAVMGVAHEESVAVGIEGVREHRFPIPRWKWLPPALQAKLDRLVLFPLFALPSVLRLLRERRHPIFYAYEASAIITARLARLLRRKHYFEVHRIQGVSVLGTSWRSFWFMVRKLETLLSLTLRADAYIMTNDGTLGDEVWRYWNRNAGPDNLLHIRNGIGAQLLIDAGGREKARAAAGLDPSLTYLLMLSRLDPIKRIDRGVRLLAALGDAYRDVRLLIVGDGEDRGPLEALAAELGVLERVQFRGGVDRSEVATIMQGADIFLSLYDFSNCGNPLFEALLSGLPVITLDNGATGSVITHDVNGFLLPVDDSERLITALRTLLDDPAQRERLRAGARQWADKNLVSWNVRMDRELKWLAGQMAR